VPKQGLFPRVRRNGKVYEAEAAESWPCRTLPFRRTPFFNLSQHLQEVVRCAEQLGVDFAEIPAGDET
jgi:hypothetical protein